MIHTYIYTFIVIYWTCIYCHKHVTNSMEHIPSWEANRFSASQIPCIVWNPKVHYQSHKSPPPVPVLSQINPVHTLLFHFLKNHFNIILSSIPGSSKWSLSVMFPHQNHIYTCPPYVLHAPHMCYMHRPSHSSWFDYLNDIGWGVQFIKVLIM